MLASRCFYGCADFVALTKYYALKLSPMLSPTLFVKKEKLYGVKIGERVLGKQTWIGQHGNE